jgi:protoporphyrinogen oxidase
MKKRIIILGAGAAGLGAAYRLKELGHENFMVYEKNNYPGGSSTSFVDSKGFTWDIGGAVHYSHYAYFDMVLEEVLKDEQIMRQGEDAIWMRSRLIPCPIHYNLRHLPRDDMQECLRNMGRNPFKKKRPRNYDEWAYSTFGEALSRIFFIPYNTKAWDYPTVSLGYKWIKDMMEEIDYAKIAENVAFNDEEGSDDESTFIYPIRGGAGKVWRRIAGKIDKISYEHEAIGIDTKARKITFRNGFVEEYDHLISTIPLPDIAGMAGMKAEGLHKASAHIIRIGIEGNMPEALKTKLRIYYPESDVPFHKATIMSNYSPYNVPKPSSNWSVMAEITETGTKTMQANIIKEVEFGLRGVGILSGKETIISRWHYHVKNAKAIPTVERDSALEILEKLEKKKIYSRGRMGAWKHEVSQQDHSFMQGVEAVDRIIGKKSEITLFNPKRVNRNKKIKMTS